MSLWMRMRRVSAGLALTLACIPTGMAALAVEPGRHPAPYEGGVYARAEDELARAQLGYLGDRSPTMREMLGVLDASQGLVTHVHSSHTLRRDVGRIGQGRLSVTVRGIFAYLEFDAGRSTPREQLEALAHEISHVVEVACMPGRPAVTSAGGLRDLLGSRALYAVRLPSALVETRFAIEAGDVVLSEALRDRGGPGGLRELARKHALAAPCGLPD